MFFKKKPKLDSYLQELAKQQVFVVSMNKNSEFTLKGASNEALQDYLDRNARDFR